MSFSDPIADMLTRIRNANMAEKKVVQVPYSKMKDAIAVILKKEGYVADFVTENLEGKKVLTLYLKYRADRTPVIQGLKRESKCGCRKYVDSTSIPRVLGGIGTAILTTSKGVMSGKEARQNGVGGELICTIW
jgi:small subunit ribosomal protein S8